MMVMMMMMMMMMIEQEVVFCFITFNMCIVDPDLSLNSINRQFSNANKLIDIDS